MSWSLSVPQSSPEDFDDNARKALKDHQDANGSWAPEQVEHFMAALKAAKAMAEAMVPDGWKHQLVATMSGHANTGHAPQDGYANDTMTVTVAQVPTDKIPETPAEEPVVQEPAPFTPGQPEPTPSMDQAPDTNSTETDADTGDTPAAAPSNIAWDAQPASPKRDSPAMPSPENPVPVDHAKEAAPAWEAMAPAQPTEPEQPAEEAPSGKEGQ